jgi:hypothetical protein
MKRDPLFCSCHVVIFTPDTHDIAEHKHLLPLHGHDIAEHKHLLPLHGHDTCSCFMGYIYFKAQLVYSFNQVLVY